MPNKKHDVKKTWTDSGHKIFTEGKQAAQATQYVKIESRTKNVVNIMHLTL